MARKYLVAIAVLFVWVPATRGQNAPDFAKQRDEAVARLQDLIRIDTSNPPGNETKVAEYLKAILDKEGIPSEILETIPGRGSLVARIKGSGAKKPLLLMGHSDVVGVERDKWAVEPFAATIKDGYVYGRGAIDNKGGITSMLQTMLMIHRQKLPLDRDIIFLAEAGEEGTTEVGMNFLVEKHWPKIEAEFALNEGGVTYVKDGKVEYVGVGAAQKVPRRIRLVARGISGHGSIPRMDNPVYHLAAAVTKIAEYQPPMRMNEVTRVFFERLAGISNPEDRYLFTHLEDPTVGLEVQEKLRRSTIRAHLRYNSMLRSSISPNIIQGGFRINVIPAEAEATLDVRLLPGDDPVVFVAVLRRVIDDPQVDVVVDDWAPFPASPAARLDTEMFRALERSQKDVFPAAVTIPLMGTGANDSAHLLANGVHAYGIAAPASDQDSEGVHGHNERISIEAMGQFVEFLYRAVVDVAAAK